MENKEIKKAKEVLETISQDEKEIRLAELREKYRMDQHAIMLAGYDKGLKDGIKQGIEQGIEQEIEQGIEQGIMQERKKIVENLLKNEVSLEQIAKITGLSKEKIENIIKK